MGSDCHVVIHGGHPGDLSFAESEVRRLEALWSRFRDDSEVTALNRAAGEPEPVSTDTVVLLCRAVRAQRLTGGWFDAFMGRDIVRIGYDRTFADLAGSVAAGPGITTRVLRSADRGTGFVRQTPEPSILVTRDPWMVRLPAGYDFDPGGIGKGLGADLVSHALIRRGVPGALVNLGGDLRCRGRHPGDGWRITISDPLGSQGALDEYVRLQDGAVATSTPLKRQWVGADGRRHNHLLHPARGASVGEEVASVTVVAPTGWLAEALCKALLVGGPRIGQPLLQKHRAAGIVVTPDGSVLRF
jgi:FAD:protein FMN transferase